MRWIAIIFLLLPMTLGHAEDDVFDEHDGEFGICEDGPPELILYPGERTEYDIKFLGMKAGEAVIECVGIEDVDGRQAYHLRAEVKSTGFYGRVYPAHLLYQTWVDAETMKPLKAFHYQKYSRWHDETKWNYKPDQNLVHRERWKFYPEQSKKENKHYVKDRFFPGSLDEEFMTMERIRRLGCPEGSQYDFRIFSDKEPYDVAVRTINSREITVEAGTYKCKVMEPLYRGEAESSFARNTRIQLFYGVKKPHPLVKVRVSLWLGSLTALLTEHRQGTPPKEEIPTVGGRIRVKASDLTPKPDTAEASPTAHHP